MLRGRHQAAATARAQTTTDLENFRTQWNLEIASRYPGRPSNTRPPLAPGQTTIITALNGGLAVRPPRPGPLPKPRSLPILPIQRQMAGGRQERSVIALFESVHAQRPAQLDDEGELLEARPRNQYSREAKLQAIQYAKYTWVQTTTGSLLPISKYQAARNLGITPIMLKNWIGNEAVILNSAKGSRRTYYRRTAKYPEVEKRLYTLFEDARHLGRNITHRWFLRHAKALYRELYPERCMQDPMTRRWTYLEMKWSNAWFQGFRRRFNISLRCKTKRAQKSPEELRPTIQNWLQFNRRNTVVLEGSDCGKLRSPEVEATRIGRFLPCHVINMDQSPLAFELTTTGRTYAKKGDHTVFLRSGPSGWEKRNCTLMIAVSADVFTAY